MANSSNRQKEIFLKALDLTSADERSAYLAQACDGDEAMRRQIDAMLQAHGQPDSFLEKPAAMGLTVDASDALPMANILPDAQIGTRIGPYKLLEQIGEGGMGVVYTADQQEPVRRKVALKIIKPGMDSGQILARFEAERQALALMDHPNIAKVLDAGATKEGRPFFVMELVKGTPITKFCDERGFTPRERLELFVMVCQAIQHAHQKGVIHRDIKPSNVLVALYDDKPVPKVIDFGVAKATGQALTERTLDTGFGAIVGTPEYMSPEQATFNQLDIDTRSDVYALGVLLYELLTGTTPVDKARLREAALLEVLRIVREDEPPRPSVKMSTSKASAMIAKTCGIDAVDLARLLRGELDWIVMKSLEKDRNRRYDTAASLARDVERYLKDEIVEARPPSLAYRVQKVFRKNRGIVIATSLVLLALIGGVIGTTAAMFRAWAAEKDTRDARDTIQANLVVVEGLNDDVTKALVKAEKNEKAAEKARDEALAAEEDALKNEKEAKRQALRADTSRHAIQMDRIFRAWERDDMITATRILDEAPEAFRTTIEYRYLRDLCQRQALPILAAADVPNAAPIAGRIICSDGKTTVVTYRVASPMDPGQITIWDVAATLREKLSFQLTEQLADTRSVVLSPDGKRLTYAGGSKAPYKLYLADAATGQKLLTIPLPSYSSHSYRPVFSPDGKLLAVPHRGVKVLEVSTGKEKLHIPGGEHTHLAAFSPDGQRMAVANANAPSGLCIYAVADGKKVLTVQQDAAVGQASFSPDGKWLLAYQRVQLRPDINVKVWDANTGKEKFSRAPLPPGQGYVYNVGFADGGNTVVIIHTKPHVEARLFDLETGKEKPFTGPLGPTTCEFLDCDGQRVLAWQDRHLFLRSLRKVALAPVTLEVGGFVQGLAFTSEDRVHGVHFLSPNRVLATWDTATGRITQITLPVNAAKLVQDAYNPFVTPDGKRVVCPDLKNKVIRIVDAASGKELAAVPCGLAWRTSLSPNGERLLEFSEGTAPKLWDVPQQREIRTTSRIEEQKYAFSPDSRWFAASHGDVIDLWDARAGKKVLSINTHGWRSEQLLYFADSKRLLSYHRPLGLTELINIWDAHTGALQGSMRVESHEGRGATVVLSADGTRLALGNNIYDVALGERVLAFPADVTIWAFSPDGRRILATYVDQTKPRFGIFAAP